MSIHGHVASQHSERTFQRPCGRTELNKLHDTGAGLVTTGLDRCHIFARRMGLRRRGELMHPIRMRGRRRGRCYKNANKGNRQPSGQ